jgi:N-methylhydantoinase A
MLLLAIDIGGTFTDLMGFDEAEGRFFTAKSLTTPQNLVQGIIDCIRQSGVELGRVAELIHGSTTAINTLIERKGAKTGLIVTRGSRDAYIIGRGNRMEAYNVFFRRHEPLLPRHMTREVGGRMLADGTEYEPLNEADIEAACKYLAAQDVQAVALCFLHSYNDPAHERRAGEIVRRLLPNAYVSLSHEILREYREFERISTTVVNAYLGPIVGGYVQRLEDNLRQVGFAGELTIMQSNGGVMTPQVATRKPVTMMESGPVGGIIASAVVGSALGYRNVISFDMGGTTAKASLVKDGQPAMESGYYVGGLASGHPVMAPVIDVVEVGAGGGSIAWIDEIGALKVGPRSAGAEPGPICYGSGGTEPTITDANVVLGRLDAKAFLGGRMALDADAARAGIEQKIAKPLGLDIIEAARAIIEIAVSRMSLAVREVSVAKGYDPRDFALVASGGNGALHVLSIARELHIPTVIVPNFPGHFSAVGMLIADERQDYVRTWFAALEGLHTADLVAAFEDMMREAEANLRRNREVDTIAELDLRYVGQEFSISVPTSLEELRGGDWHPIRRRFDELHEQRYAHHSPDEPVEIVNLRLAAIGKRPPLVFPVQPPAQARPVRTQMVTFDDVAHPVACPVYERSELGAGTEIAGPAVIQEEATTTLLWPGDNGKRAATGEIIIQLAAVQEDLS